jgi:Leucine-rich repeat (LRR) protein
MGCSNAALSEIRLLDLSGARITSKGLQSISSLTGLRCLDLRQTDMSANAVDVLTSLTSLEWLHVGGTAIGALSRQRLKRKLPRLSIATRPTNRPSG